MIRIKSLVVILFIVSGEAGAIEVLSSPLTSSFGVGAGLRAENQYSDIQPTMGPTFSLSEDFRWRGLQALIEWTRWSESSGAGSLTVNHRQDLYSLFQRVEVLRDGWLGVFLGVGLGFQQDHVETGFASTHRTSSGGLDTYYGGEAGFTFYILSELELQISGRLTSQSHDSRWNQWLGARLAYRVF